VVDAADLVPLGRYLNLTEQDYLRRGGLRYDFGLLDINRDHLVTVADLTSVAQHYHERIDGYRIYRRLLGSGAWAMLPNPASASAPATLLRSQAGPADAQSAVPEYSFYDMPPLATDVEYRIVPFCLGDGDGVASLPHAVRAPAYSAEAVGGDYPNGVSLENDPRAVKPGVEWLCSVWNLASAPSASKVELDIGADGTYEKSILCNSVSDADRTPLATTRTGALVVRTRVTGRTGLVG
jgi:hypothetical protein